MQWAFEGECYLTSISSPELITYRKFDFSSSWTNMNTSCYNKILICIRHVSIKILWEFFLCLLLRLTWTLKLPCSTMLIFIWFLLSQSHKEYMKKDGFCCEHVNYVSLCRFFIFFHHNEFIDSSKSIWYFPILFYVFETK